VDDQEDVKTQDEPAVEQDGNLYCLLHLWFIYNCLYTSNNSNQNLN
jgi:hypothetical protein